MRIGIDARSLHYEGVGRYIKELIRNLSALDRSNEYIVYFLSEQSLMENAVKQSNFHNTVLQIGIYDLHKQPCLYYRLYRDNLDIFHATDHWIVPFIATCPVVVTVNDVLVMTARKNLSCKVLAYGTIVTRIALSAAKRIIAVSDFARKEVVEMIPRTEKKISVIYHGVGEEFTPHGDSEISAIREKYQIDKRYILYVGSLKSHKNVPRIIEAFSRLPVSVRQKTDLVIAARLESRFSNVIKLPSLFGIENNVRFAGYVPTRDLPALYSGADAFILPSLTECFGLPIIEAMACGVPVMASKAGAIPEIGGDAGIYFDPESTDDIYHTMLRMLTDEGLRKRLSGMGLERSKNFSWKIAAQKILQVYEDVYRQNRILKQERQPVESSPYL